MVKTARAKTNASENIRQMWSNKARAKTNAVDIHSKCFRSGFALISALIHPQLSVNTLAAKAAAQQ
ncbi:hypothetical protein CJ216_00215 [Gardnerella greenwoodii]|uniref:Uncharacterized protein n=1 Tax=Gardnerella greenwoodii TaxID=2914925 RepID=A0A2N6RWU8_9BIFI|nr:hypothetical protein CJ216_00215 [Gardnerella greenwoodii]